MLSSQQLDVVALMLTNRFGNGFAFYVVNKDDGSHEINVALPHTTVAGTTWNSTIQAIQSLAGERVFKTGPMPTIYTGTAVAYSNAAEGMRRFLGINVTIRNLAAYNGQVIPGWTQMRTYLPQDTEFSEILPDGILRRNELDPFIPTNPGPAPGFGIDFDSRSSHIHRIYMALAFWRAHLKYTGRNERGHLIAAVIVDRRDGRVRVVAHNTKNVNPSFHAEVNAVQALLKHSDADRTQPFIVYTTLQPCPMCAAMIAEYLPNAMVFYGQMDPGSHMQNMVTQPNFCRLMTERWNDPYGIKSLRGWGTSSYGGWDNYKSLQPYNGNHGDIPVELGTTHNAIKDKKVYNHKTSQYTWPYSSVTKNHRREGFKAMIDGASRTLDRKIDQYITRPNVSRKVDWTLPRNLSQGVVIIERHEDIEKVMQHIQPMLAHF